MFNLVFYYCSYSLKKILLVLQPTHLANFNQVQTIQYSNSDDKDRKGTLQLKIAGASEVRSSTNLCRTSDVQNLF